MIVIIIKFTESSIGNVVYLLLILIYLIQCLTMDDFYQFYMYAII